MLPKKTANAIGTRVAGPQEDEDRKREYPTVMNGLRMGGVVHETQHGQHGERQCHIHLTHHRVSPVVDGTFALQVKFADKQVDDAYQVGNEHGRCGRQATAIAKEGKEQVGA